MNPQERFEAALVATGVVNRDRPRVEVDGAVTYHLFDNAASEEVGWMSFLHGEPLGLTIRPKPVAPASPRPR